MSAMMLNLIFFLIYMHTEALICHLLSYTSSFSIQYTVHHILSPNQQMRCSYILNNDTFNLKSNAYFLKQYLNCFMCSYVGGYYIVEFANFD